MNCEVSNLSGWSECDVSCGGGTQNRTRSITQYPTNGGRDCPDLIQTQD